MGLDSLDHKDALFVLRKMKSVLKLNRRLHVVVPNARSLHRRIACYMNLIEDVHELSKRDRRIGQIKKCDRGILRNELKNCGFNISHWEGPFLKPFKNDKMIQLDKSLIFGLYELGRELPDYCAHIYAPCTKREAALRPA